MWEARAPLRYEEGVPITAQAIAGPENVGNAGL